MSRTEELVDAAHSAIQPGKVEAEADSPLAQQIFSMLAMKNGFYSVGSALLVRPVGGPLDVFEWNGTSGWRRRYGTAAERLFFFAEDLFGGQYATLDDRIVTFDPETGSTEDFAVSIEDWAAKVLNDFAYATGYPLAKEWQDAHGRMDPGTRLMPKIPFVADGAFEIRNLVSVEHQLRMERGAALAHTIKDTPDGETITMPYVI